MRNIKLSTFVKQYKFKDLNQFMNIIMIFKYFDYFCIYK